MINSSFFVDLHSIQIWNIMKRALFLAMSMATFLSVHAQQAGNYLADKLPGLRTRSELVNFLHNEGFEAKVDTAYMGIGDYKGHEIRFSSDKKVYCIV